MKFWNHVRLAGCVMMIVGAFTSSITLSIVGLVIHYWGVTGAVESLTRLMYALVKMDEKEDK